MGHSNILSLQTIYFLLQYNSPQMWRNYLIIQTAKFLLFSLAANSPLYLKFVQGHFALCPKTWSGQRKQGSWGFPTRMSQELS